MEEKQAEKFAKIAVSIMKEAKDNSFTAVGICEMIKTSILEVSKEDGKHKDRKH